jgi:phosphatidylserine decarboxylase
MTIHKEGRSLLVNLLLALITVNAIYVALSQAGDPMRIVVAGISAVLFLLFLQFFRSPRVKPVADEKLILAPADGKVVALEEVQENEHLGDRRIQISIFMSPVNVHVNRNPVSGAIRHFSYHPGKYLMAWQPKSSTENERTVLVYETKDGKRLLVRQIAGFLARRIICYVDKGAEVRQGEEFGFIKFGSRLDVLVPAGSEILVRLGSITRAGRTPLAHWP